MAKRCEICGDRSVATILYPSYAPGEPKECCWPCHDGAIAKEIKD